MKIEPISVKFVDNGVYIKVTENDMKGGDKDVTATISENLYRLLKNNRYMIDELYDIAEKSKSAILAGVVAVLRLRRITGNSKGGEQLD